MREDGRRTTSDSSRKMIDVHRIGSIGYILDVPILRYDPVHCTAVMRSNFTAKNPQICHMERTSYEIKEKKPTEIYGTRVA